jgi:hypothetical protein
MDIEWQIMEAAVFTDWLDPLDEFKIEIATLLARDMGAKSVRSVYTTGEDQKSESSSSKSETSLDDIPF